MRVLVVGASTVNAGRIGEAASAHGLQVLTGHASSRADWVLVATGAQRRDALARTSLPAYRVIQVPELARDGALDAAAHQRLVLGLTRMVEIGPHQPVVPPVARRLTTWLMPWIAARLERELGPDVLDADAVMTQKAKLVAERAAERARLREGVPEVSEEKARLRAQKKADRKAARRAEKPSIVDPSVRPPTP